MPFYIVLKEEAGNRIDKYICEKASISRSLCKDCFIKGLITVNGKEVKQSYSIKENDEIFLDEIEITEYEIIPENLKASFGAFMMIFRCDASKYLYYILNSNVFLATITVT